MARPIRPHLALLPLLLVACHRGGSSPAVRTVAPRIVGDVTIAANDIAWVPQAAIVSVSTDLPTQVDLHIDDGERTWDAVADATWSTEHPRVPVVGMRADRVHTISVTVRAADGSVTAAPAPLTFTTPPLPTGFPEITVTTSMPQYMESGVRLVSILSQNLGSVPAILDAEGEVLWYLDTSRSPLFGGQVMVFPMQNGHLMLVANWRALIEVDMLGTVLVAHNASRLLGGVTGTVSVDTDSFHHDFVEMPEGSGAEYAVLGTELRHFTDYPSDVVTPGVGVGDADVVGDEIVEFLRDGTITRRFRLLDLLDPYRMCYDTLGNFWDTVYGIPTRDWSHANAIVLDRATDSWIVSLRHQDCLVKIGRQTGTVEWILGDHDRWQAAWQPYLLTPVGSGFQWQYHQHAPELQADGSLLVFDNGNGRAIPPAAALPFPQSYSRAVQFRVDEGNRTVEQPWVYGGAPGGSGPSFYSFFVSSAYRMHDTGNVLVCDGGKMTATGRMYARVFEITTETLPQVVFECGIGADGVTSTESYFAYRAYRLAGVYR